MRASYLPTDFQFALASRAEIQAWLTRARSSWGGATALVSFAVAACVGCGTMPVSPTARLAFSAVSTGVYHTCAVTAAGAAYCWGHNYYGELGDGTRTNRSSPVLVAGGVRFAAVSAGGFHTCALTAAGAAYCWGSNYYGELGDGTTTDRSSPVPVVQ